MKLCPVCGQAVSEEIGTCPSCGGRTAEGRRTIDDYRIVDVLHEGHSTFLCRAVRERTSEEVMIRLFTSRSGVDEKVAERLQREIEELKKLPDAGFVRHHAIRRSADGLWYRISEWVESESWGSLLASGRLADRRLLFGLFHRMAATLAVLHAHEHFIPHLILNDIIAVPEGEGGLGIRIDYKLSRFIDPRFDRPAPMLKQLLAQHPDIVSQRPLPRAGARHFPDDAWGQAVRHSRRRPPCPRWSGCTSPSPSSPSTSRRRCCSPWCAWSSRASRMRTRRCDERRNDNSVLRNPRHCPPSAYHCGKQLAVR